MSSFHRRQKLLFLPFLVHVNSGNFRATVTYFLKNISRTVHRKFSCDASMCKKGVFLSRTWSYFSFFPEQGQQLSWKTFVLWQPNNIHQKPAPAIMNNGNAKLLRAALVESFWDDNYSREGSIWNFNLGQKQKKTDGGGMGLANLQW